MESWNTRFRSFYYETAPEPEDIVLPRAETALLMIDVQNTDVAPRDTEAEARRWTPFMARMRETVIPNAARLIETCRREGVEVIHARIACLKNDGRDRSPSRKKPGFNYLLMPKDSEESQIVP